MTKPELNKIYRRSLNLDSLIAFLIGITIMISVAIFYPEINKILFVFIVLLLSFGYSLIGDIFLGYRSIGMRVYNLKIELSSHNMFYTIALQLYRKLIVASYIPFVGPSFDELCRKADANTSSHISLFK